MAAQKASVIDNSQCCVRRGNDDEDGGRTYGNPKGVMLKRAESSSVEHADDDKTPSENPRGTTTRTRYSPDAVFSIHIDGTAEPGVRDHHCPRS